MSYISLLRHYFTKFVSSIGADVYHVAAADKVKEIKVDKTGEVPALFLGYTFPPFF